MGIFERSWKLAKLSFGVIWKDKEILAFPIVGGIVGLLVIGFILILRLGNLLAGLSSGGASQVFSFIDVLLVILGYFVLVMIMVFTEACVVYTAKKRLEGGNAGFFESIGVAFGKAPSLIGWSIITGTVGIIMKGLENVAKKSKGIGSIVLGVMRGVIGLAWTVLTAFVVQGIVINSNGPIEAIKESALLLKKTWGERLIREFGFGVVMFLSLLIGLLILAPLWALAIAVGEAVGIVSMFVFSAGFLFVWVLLFEIAEDVYMTALYLYATTGKIPEGFDEESMTGAFKQEGN